MNKIDKLIERINFKKAAVLYVISALIISVILTLFLGYKFKDKIIFAINYDKVSEKVEHNTDEIDTIKNDVENLASKSNDIVDILILDKENKILFSAKDSKFNKDNFILESNKNEKNSYLMYSEDNDIAFKLVKNDELMLNTIVSPYYKEIEDEHNNDIFFKNNFNSKEIYLLSYIANKHTGNKVYFISQINPVQNSKLYIKIVQVIFTGFLMVYWVLVGLFIYQNSKKSKLNPYLWTAITLVTNIAGVLIYFIYKQNNQTCYKCGAVQNKNNIYCSYCGTKISNTCSKCNKVINRNDKFCTQCGNEINNETK